MPMKYPAHPGRIIQSDMKALRMGVEETSLKLGVTPEELARVVNGESGVTADLAVRLGKLFGGGADIWRRLQAAYDEAQERNKYATPEPEPFTPFQERAVVPLKGGRAVYTTFDDSVLRFRYLQSGSTVFPWYGNGRYDQVQIRFGGSGPGALQVQLVHQARPSDAPRLVADALFKAYLVWTGDPDGRPLARVDSNEWKREWSKLPAGKRMMRDLYAGLAKPAVLPVFIDDEFVETGSERQVIVLKEAEALEKNYSKVVSYRAFAGV